MRVHCSRALKAQLVADGAHPRELCLAFGRWKFKWPEFEFESTLFGKDGAYVAPLVGGRRYLLRHVHLEPVHDHAGKRRWAKVFSWRGTKTSDRALVYVHRPVTDEYLLIYILNEPDAHAVASMRLVAHREIMEGFANVAAAFIDSGDVIA